MMCNRVPLSVSPIKVNRVPLSVSPIKVNRVPLSVSPIKVNRFAVLFNCTTVSWAIDLVRIQS